MFYFFRQTRETGVSERQDLPKVKVQFCNSSHFMTASQVKRGHHQGGTSKNSSNHLLVDNKLCLSDHEIMTH